jgi:hypothetical protein
VRIAYAVLAAPGTNFRRGTESMCSSTRAVGTACRRIRTTPVSQHDEVPDPQAHRRPLLKALAAGTAAVGGIAVASRSGLLSGDEPVGSGPNGLPLLQLAADDGSDVAALEAPLGDGLLPQVSRRRWRSARLPTTTHSMVGFVWPRDEPEPRLFISSRRSSVWTDWQRVPLLHDLPDEQDAEWSTRFGTQLVWIGAADGIRIRAEGHRPAGLTLVLLHPRSRQGDVHLSSALAARASADGATGEAPRPPMLGRKEWGADESWRNGGPRYNDTIQQVHVHHTANSNDYSEDEVPALLRGIYRYHTHTLGWSDIAYNFLVDRFGRTWVGRAGGAAKPVRGAHTLGFNGTSTGVAVIGNYEIVDAGPATLTAIVRLAAWKLAMYGRDPEGTAAVVSEGSDKYAASQLVVLPVIDGHRDTNDTACPGQHLYDRLPDIRDRVKQRMQAAAQPSVTITTPFQLTGESVVGATLTVTSGTYSPPDAVVSYTWLRNGAPTGDSPALASRPIVPEDVGQQISVQVDVQRTGYTAASQLLTAPATVETQATLDVRVHAQHGNIRVVVRASALGVVGPVTGDVRIRVDRRPPRTLALADGLAVARFVAFGRGDHAVRVAYRAASPIRSARARTTIHVKN